MCKWWEEEFVEIKVKIEVGEKEVKSIKEILTTKMKDDKIDLIDEPKVDKFFDCDVFTLLRLQLELLEKEGLDKTLSERGKALKEEKHKAAYAVPPSNIISQQELIDAQKAVEDANGKYTSAVDDAGRNAAKIELGKANADLGLVNKKIKATNDAPKHIDKILEKLKDGKSGHDARVLKYKAMVTNQDEKVKNKEKKVKVEISELDKIAKEVAAFDKDIKSQKDELRKKEDSFGYTKDIENKIDGLRKSREERYGKIGDKIKNINDKHLTEFQPELNDWKIVSQSQIDEEKKAKKCETVIKFMEEEANLAAIVLKLAAILSGQQPV